MNISSHSFYKHYCCICKRTFFAKRPDALTCSLKCRKRKSRLNNKEEQTTKNNHGTRIKITQTLPSYTTPDGDPYEPIPVKLKIRHGNYGVMIECQKCGINHPIHVNRNKPVGWRISDYISHLKLDHNINDQSFLERISMEVRNIFSRYQIFN